MQLATVAGASPESTTHKGLRVEGGAAGLADLQAGYWRSVMAAGGAEGVRRYGWMSESAGAREQQALEHMRKAQELDNRVPLPY